MIQPIQIVVLGEPQAQKRHRHFKRGNFVQTYDPSKEKKQDFLWIAQQKAPAVPIDEPIHLTIGLYFGRPKSHFGTGKNSHVIKAAAPTWHTGKPDIDNIVKFAMDAMNKIFWKDDSIICSLSVKKQYDFNPRIEITITSAY